MKSPAHSSHRNSIAWQKGMQLAALAYRLTQSFPQAERFGLTSQIRRAAVSIPSNIAEGKGRFTTGEVIQFLGNARGSILELQTQLELAATLGYLSSESAEEAIQFAIEITKILNATVTTLRSRPPRQTRR